MIDPRISLAAQAPDLNSSFQMFQSALNNAQNRKASQQQLEQSAALQPGVLKQQGQVIDANTQAANVEAQNQNLVSIAATIPELRGFISKGDSLGALAFLQRRKESLASQGRNPAETDEAIQSVMSGNLDQLGQDLDIVEREVVSRGLTGQGAASVGQREFNSLIKQAQGDPDDLVTKAARIKLRLDAPAGTSAQERIATDSELGDKIVKQAAAESGAKEGSKLEAQRKALPKIKSLVKLAEKEATERGDTLTALQRSKAALPGLTDSVGQLKELAMIATSTIGGSVFDFAVKQTGFGSTKGATAKAKFIAIVNNQVLPLLKETFGAAFTATEGESLKATMGDPNASPEEKMAQLDAFIAQKARDIQTKEAQLSSTDDFAGFKVIR